VHPPDRCGRADPPGPGGEQGVGTVAAASGRPAQDGVLDVGVGGIDVDAGQGVDAQAAAELVDHPPRRPRVAHGRGHRGDVRPQQVSALELASDGQHVGGHGGELVLDDIDHGQEVQ
jgi:hypothetical protein